MSRVQFSQFQLCLCLSSLVRLHLVLACPIQEALLLEEDELALWLVEVYLASMGHLVEHTVRDIQVDGCLFKVKHWL